MAPSGKLSGRNDSPGCTKLVPLALTGKRPIFLAGGCSNHGGT